MRNDLSFSALFMKIRKLFLPWLIVAVIAGVAVLGYTYVNLADRFQASATVTYSYNGIETGLNPNGDLFDVNEIRSAQVITAAAESAGLELKDGDLEKIQAAIRISGVLPDGIMDRFTQLKSIYSSDSIAVRSTQQATAYYPSQYKIVFRFTDAGLSQADGNKMLSALLDAYRSDFYNRYGYNNELETRALDADLSGYEYEGAIRVLNNRLNLLSGYTEELEAEDTSLFRSEKTGYSFGDLSAAINILRTEDVSTLSSYISSNHVSRDWNQQRNEYLYLIEETQRNEKAQQEKIDTLSYVIEHYSKPRAVVSGGTETQTSSASGDEEIPSTTSSSVYQVTQPSVMYDALIRQRVSMSTELSTLEQQVVLYQSSLESLTGSSAQEMGKYVEDELNRISSKMKDLVSSIKETTDEYVKTIKLKNAFQITDTQLASSFPAARLLSSALWTGVAVEGIIFGIFLLLAMKKAWWAPRNRNRKAVKPHAEA